MLKKIVENVGMQWKGFEHHFSHKKLMVSPVDIKMSMCSGL